MTQYLLSLYQADGEPPPEVMARMDQIMRDVDAMIEETRSAGAWVFNGGLFPADTSTVLRHDGADLLVTDGPYTEGKEHLGGFVVVSSPDLDAALGWGRKLARATGLPVEVRPFASTG